MYIFALRLLTYLRTEYVFPPIFWGLKHVNKKNQIKDSLSLY